jgi:hypothetical protein
LATANRARVMNPNDLDYISAEDAAVDRKINNICRGC